MPPWLHGSSLVGQFSAYWNPWDSRIPIYQLINFVGPSPSSHLQIKHTHNVTDCFPGSWVWKHSLPSLCCLQVIHLGSQRVPVLSPPSPADMGASQELNPLKAVSSFNHSYFLHNCLSSFFFEPLQACFVLPLLYIAILFYYYICYYISYLEFQLITDELSIFRLRNPPLCIEPS